MLKLEAPAAPYNPKPSDRSIDTDRARFFTVIERASGKALCKPRSWVAAKRAARRHNSTTRLDTCVLFEDRSDLCLLFVRFR